MTEAPPVYDTREWEEVFTHLIQCGLVARLSDAPLTSKEWFLYTQYFGEGS